ncbi:MAG: antibiotic biosynthesis monooxygenase family protein [Balneolaceae bacterium]
MKSEESNREERSMSAANRKQFTAISTFKVGNNMEEEVKQAFLSRPGFVESADGFIGLDVLRPLDNLAEFWLITHWESREAFEYWHRHHKSESHQGIPKGLKLVKRSFELRHFEHITD